MKKLYSRRNAFQKIVGSTLGLGISLKTMPAPESPKTLKGNINHSVCKWCYGNMSFEEFAEGKKNIGVKVVDLVALNEFDLLKKYDLSFSMVSFSSKKWEISKGWKQKENHEGLVEWYK